MHPQAFQESPRASMSFQRALTRHPRTLSILSLDSFSNKQCPDDDLDPMSAFTTNFSTLELASLGLPQICTNLEAPLTGSTRLRGRIF